jgi:hypothetical protein
LQPTHRGTAPAPLNPSERARRGLSGQVEAEPATPAAPREATLTPRPTRFRSRRVFVLERHWYDCLLYPLFTWPLAAPLAVALTALTGITALAGPDVSSLHTAPWWVLAVIWVAPFLTLGYTCAYLHCVFASAADGETGFSRWPGSDIALVARSLATWLMCFLAGPVLFAGAAFGFWYYGGDQAVIDWLILAELCVVGATHWLVTLVTVQQAECWRDANPLRVTEVIRRLGYSAVFAALAATTVALGIGLVILYALTRLHEEPLEGWLLLLGGWFAMLSWLTFLFRLFGLWCFQSRVEMTEPAPASTAAARDSLYNE